MTSSVTPRSVTSSSAKMSTRVVSDGGEPVSLSLFWGLSDGGTNANTNPADPNLWDYRVADLDGNHSDGLLSQYVDGLSMNTNYYYRWLAGNSVSSENWSVASEEGMLAYWDFDESGGSFSTDSVESRIASFIGNFRFRPSFRKER